MFCNKCGAQIPDGSRFCSNCGTTLSNYLSNDSHGKSRKKQDSNWFMKFIAFLLVAAIVLGGWFLSSLNLYVYSKMTTHGNANVSANALQKIENAYSGTYLYDAKDDYHIVDLESGLEGLGSDLNEMSGDLLKASVECGEKYAYIQFSVPSSDYSITFTYYKANVLERIKFASHYFI